MEAREAAETRFEFARKHILQERRLQEKFDDAWEACYVWHHALDKEGAYVDTSKKRKPRTPEEREELKALEAAVLDAETRLMLHRNDGAAL